MAVYYAERFTQRQTYQTYYDQFGRPYTFIQREQVYERVPVLEHKKILPPQQSQQTLLDQAGRTIETISRFVGGFLR